MEKLLTFDILCGSILLTRLRWEKRILGLGIRKQKMVRAKLHLITAVLFLILGSLAGAGFMDATQKPETITEVVFKYIEVPKEVILIKEIPVETIRLVKVDRELSDFTSIKEFEEVISRHTDGLTFLGGDCVEGARFLVEVLGNGGYYIDTEIESGHMIVKGFVSNKWHKAICFYDPRTDRFWYAMKVNSVYRVPETIGQTPSEPNWGKGGKPKKDK